MLILFCILSISKGQDSVPDKPEFLLGVYTGYSRHIIRDEVASPLIYRGGSSPVLLEFGYQKSRSRQALSFFIGNTKLSSSNTNKSGSNTNYADNLNVLLAYSYSRNTRIFQRYNVNCYWGFTFLSVINYRRLYFNNSSSILFFEQINSLGANFLIEKSIGSKKNDIVSFKINLPFVAYVTFNDRYNSVVGRSLDNYNLNNGVFGQVISNGEFVTFNKLFEFQTKFSYTRFLTKHLGLSLEHQLHFYSISHYQNLLYARYLNNQYLIGLIIKL
jgi:hypothetical protein